MLQAAAGTQPGRAEVPMAAWLSVAAVVALLDQLSKYWVTATLRPGETLNVLPFFDLVLWFNRGAAFSFLAAEGGWQRAFFIGIAVAAAVLIVWLLRRHRGEILFCTGLALILGGALGNLWDRVALGHVVDFLLFHAGAYYWPAFNVADSAITLGAALIIIDGFRHKDRAPRLKHE
jgi:signal peptidase II